MMVVCCIEMEKKPFYNACFKRYAAVQQYFIQVYMKQPENKAHIDEQEHVCVHPVNSP